MVKTRVVDVQFSIHEAQKMPSGMLKNKNKVKQLGRHARTIEPFEVKLLEIHMPKFINIIPRNLNYLLKILLDIHIIS